MKQKNKIAVKNHGINAMASFGSNKHRFHLLLESRSVQRHGSSVRPKYDKTYALAHGPSEAKSKKERKIVSLLGNIAGKHILEIGCNTGEFCALLKAHGALPFGIDLNVSAIKIAEKRFPKIRFKCLPIEKFRTRQRFDIAIMIDVIEHLENPVAALKKTRALLKKNGFLLISTGNGWDYVSKAKCFFQRIPFLFDPTHTCEFNFLSLKNALERSGFRIKKMTSWPFPLLWYFLENAGCWVFGLNLIAIAERN